MSYFVSKPILTRFIFIFILGALFLFIGTNRAFSDNKNIEKGIKDTEKKVDLKIQSTVEHSEGKPWKAVTYLEKPEAGPMVANGRELLTNGSGRFAIDINSYVEVFFSRKELLTELASYLKYDDAVASVSKRINMLSDSMKSIPELVNSYTLAYDKFYAFIENSQSKELEDAKNNARRYAANKMLETVFYFPGDERSYTLQEIIMERLIEKENLDEVAAHKKSSAILRAYIKEGDNLIMGYNWDGLKNLFEKEIEYALNDLERELESSGLSIQLQAHFVSRDGSTNSAVFLQGHNTVTDCIPTPFEKIVFDIPPEASESFNKYRESVEDFQEAIGDEAASILTLVKSFYKVEFDSFTSNFKDIQGAITTLRRKNTKFGYMGGQRETGTMV